MPARSLAWLSYKTSQQYRGISPLMSSLNAFQDAYEGIHWNLGKMKAAASVALGIFRDSIDDSIGENRVASYLEGAEDGSVDTFYDTEMLPGINKLEFLPGDRAEWMDNKTPPAETVAFIEFVLSCALKSLDLPDTFLREQDGTFFSNRAAWNAYKRTARPKQQDVSEWLLELTRWRIGTALVDGLFGPLPRGMEFNDVTYEWRHLGSEWGNPQQEATGALIAIAGGLDNCERWAEEHGTDIKENIDTNIKWLKYSIDAAAAAGVDYQIATSPNFTCDEAATMPQEEQPNGR